jgi:hypothetical protein
MVPPYLFRPKTSFALKAAAKLSLASRPKPAARHKGKRLPPFLFGA